MWLSRKQPRNFHQPRLRHERVDKLIQIDRSDHRWFEDRTDDCAFLAFTGDTASTMMRMRFVPSESTFGYFGRAVWLPEVWSDNMSRATLSCSILHNLCSSIGHITKLF